MNRCEFVPCLYDSECRQGHICNNNRYCYRDTVDQGVVECNKSHLYAFRNTTSMKVVEVPSINRCMGAKCTQSSECAKEAPFCETRIDGGKCVQPIIFTATIITGAVAIVIGITFGYLISYCRTRRIMKRMNQTTN